MDHFKKIVGEETFFLNLDKENLEKWNQVGDLAEKLFVNELDEILSEAQRTLGVLTISNSDKKVIRYEKKNFYERYSLKVYPLVEVQYYPEPIYLSNNKGKDISSVFKHECSLSFILNFSKQNKISNTFRDNSFIDISLSIKGDHDLLKLKSLFLLNRRLFEIIIKKSKLNVDYKLENDMDDLSTNSSIKVLDIFGSESKNFKTLTFSTIFNTYRANINSFFVFAALYDGIYHAVCNKNYDRLIANYHLYSDYLS